MDSRPAPLTRRRHVDLARTSGALCPGR
ncbi:putative leader peptide [Streptomyces hydrogenans]